MILTLKVECVYGMYLKEECIRVIEIRDRASLCDLHEAIQDAVQFDQDHLFGFFTANSASPYANRHWLTDEEAWDDVVDDYQSIRLTDIWPLGPKKLYYLFDFGDSWTFEIRKSRRVREPEKGVSYPRVVEAVGPDPEQYPYWEE